MVILFAVIATYQAIRISNSEQALHYVVVTKYDSFEKARKHHTNCPDWCEASIVKVNEDGKTRYYAVSNCYYSRAEAMLLALLYKADYLDATVWSTSQRPNIVIMGSYCSGKDIDLKPE